MMQNCAKGWKKKKKDTLSTTNLVVVVSQFNGTSTPKGSFSAKTGDNDCNVNSSCYSPSTALFESISLSGQVWTKYPTRPDTQGTPRGAPLMHPQLILVHLKTRYMNHMQSSAWTFVCFFCFFFSFLREMVW